MQRDVEDAGVGGAGGGELARGDQVRLDRAVLAHSPALGGDLAAGGVEPHAGELAEAVLRLLGVAVRGEVVDEKRQVRDGVRAADEAERGAALGGAGEHFLDAVVVDVGGEVLHREAAVCGLEGGSAAHQVHGGVVRLEHRSPGLREQRSERAAEQPGILGLEGALLPCGAELLGVGGGCGQREDVEQRRLDLDVVDHALGADRAGGVDEERLTGLGGAPPEGRVDEAVARDGLAGFADCVPRLVFAAPGGGLDQVRPGQRLCPGAGAQLLLVELHEGRFDLRVAVVVRDGVTASIADVAEETDRDHVRGAGDLAVRAVVLHGDGLDLGPAVEDRGVARLPLLLAVLVGVVGEHPLHADGDAVDDVVLLTLDHGSLAGVAAIESGSAAAVALAAAVARAAGAAAGLERDGEGAGVAGRLVLVLDGLRRGGLGCRRPERRGDVGGNFKPGDLEGVAGDLCGLTDGGGELVPGGLRTLAQLVSEQRLQ